MHAHAAAQEATTMLENAYLSYLAETNRPTTAEEIRGALNLPHHDKNGLIRSLLFKMKEEGRVIQQYPRGPWSLPD